MCSIWLFKLTVSICLALVYFVTSSQAQVDRRITRNALDNEVRIL